ncbi:unnamed protein product, partial [Rotaria sp. Silwood2]
LIETITGKLL